MIALVNGRLSDRSVRRWSAAPWLTLPLPVPQPLPLPLTRCGGPTFDGVLVFDEVHKAENLAPYPYPLTSASPQPHLSP